MAGYETELLAGTELSGRWRSLVDGWISGNGFRSVSDAASTTLEFELSPAGDRVTVRFMATAKLLVALMTDGTFLGPDRLALGAAAANAWNIEQLLPMLSVWDPQGPRPFLAGVCVLPLRVRMTRADFESVADSWIGQGRQMFLRCHEVFEL